jgi:hypothetical protein
MWPPAPPSQGRPRGGALPKDPTDRSSAGHEVHRSGKTTTEVTETTEADQPAARRASTACSVSSVVNPSSPLDMG